MIAGLFSRNRLNRKIRSYWAAMDSCCRNSTVVISQRSKCTHWNGSVKLKYVTRLGSFMGAGSDRWEFTGCRRGARFRAADVRQNQFEQIKLCSLKAPSDVLECSPIFL